MKFKALNDCVYKLTSKYTVSQKNIPDIYSCNSRKHCRILLMFGTYVTEKLSNQFPTTPN